MVFDVSNATLRIKWNTGKMTINCKEFFPCAQEKAKRFFKIAFNDSDFDFETVDALLAFFKEYALSIQSSISALSSLQSRHDERAKQIKASNPRRGTDLYREYMSERETANDCAIQVRAQHARLRMLKGNRDLLSEMREKLL